MYSEIEGTVNVTCSIGERTMRGSEAFQLLDAQSYHPAIRAAMVSWNIKPSALNPNWLC